MVKLHVSEEATWVHDFVDDSLDRFRRKATEVAAERADHAGVQGENGVEPSRGGVDLAATQFMCAHVRRQDFKASCARYEEEYRSGRYIHHCRSLFCIRWQVFRGVVDCIRCDATSSST